MWFLCNEQIRSKFHPSDQTIWASVFVRDSGHEQDDCRLFHQLTVAHFHEAPPMRGFLFVQNALIPVTTKVRGYLYVFWCLVMRALSEMSCQKCEKPHGIRRAFFCLAALFAFAPSIQKLYCLYFPKASNLQNYFRLCRYQWKFFLQFSPESIKHF